VRAKVIEIVAANATTWRPPDVLTIVSPATPFRGGCAELTPFKIDIAWIKASPSKPLMQTAQGIIYICWML
jgi:hypothetical protein